MSNNEKRFEMKEWIGVFDNYITPDMCEHAISFFHKNHEFNKLYDRFQSENKISHHMKKDVAKNIWPNDIWEDKENLKPLFLNFDIALKTYIERIGIGTDFDPLHYTNIKIQQTVPTGGYHVWHCEWGGQGTQEVRKRFLTYIIYLNDIKDGGETEFLHQSTRVQPKAGRIVIWPASFPYYHRGNPPLKEKKYIITSWILAGDN